MIRFDVTIVPENHPTSPPCATVKMNELFMNVYVVTMYRLLACEHSLRRIRNDWKNLSGLEKDVKMVELTPVSSRYLSCPASK
uniref:Uncharacterized protein n=1 Tax=Setaria digitata TaxID=48799 RepID=A0A915Q7Z4_9BILA